MNEKQNGKKLKLCIGIHNHQPFGNFDFVIEDALEKCYSPFIEVIKQHPSVKWVTHFSGPLLLWLKKRNHPIINDLNELKSRGQIELLGSGIGEPILCSLPLRDIEAQLEEMSALMQELFGQTPRGIWLTERVWEPMLPAILKKAGVDFALVDDHHFFYAGFERKNLYGYYTVEKHGYALKIFPISQALRYRIPFKPVPEFAIELEEWRNSLPDDKNSFTLTYMDDGEKFGLWPGTHEWVYKERWLHLFLEMLERNSNRIETKLLSEIAAEERPAGRASLPTASYHEMMEWALPVKAATERQKLSEQLGEENYDKIRGGYWDQFLVKYEESNRIHKRAVNLSERLFELENKYKGNENTKGDLVAARKLLHQGQCNDVYWHGLFGGLYLPFLRSTINRALMEADMLLDRVEPKNGAFETDFDRDCENEFVVRNAEQTLVLSAAHGGAVYLWDNHNAKLSLSDVLTRRPEAYHDKVREAALQENDGKPVSIHDITACKEKDLDKYLVYDRALRTTGRTFLAVGKPDAETLRFDRFTEHSNLGNAPYKQTPIKESTSEYAVGFNTGDVKTAIEKTYKIPKSGFGWQLGLSMPKAPVADDDIYMCIEFNFTLDALDDDRYILNDKSERIALNDETDWDKVEKLEIVDKARDFSIKLSLSSAAGVAVYPIETVSVSESGFERNYQGTCLTIIIPVFLTVNSQFVIGVS